MSSVNLVFYQMDESVPLIKELAKHYQGNKKFDVNFIPTPGECVQFCATTGNGIILFKISQKKDLQDAVYVLKSLKNEIKSGAIKPACLIYVKNNKVERVLSKYGCNDFLESDIRAKTLSFKIDFWSKSIESLVRKQDYDISVKQAKLQKTIKEERDAKEFIETPALELQSDIWLVKSSSDYKKILRRWLIRLLGPSPHMGSWQELEAKAGEDLSRWKFILKEEEFSRFVVDDGAWFFYGSKPEFDWKTNRWIFSSDRPYLYFRTRANEVFSRFEFIDNQVHIAKNSTFAEMKEEIILETCESQFNIEGDKKEDENENSVSTAKEATASKSEEALGEESVNEKQTPRKSTYQEDDLGGVMSGRTNSNNEANDNPLRGKNSRSSVNGPLTGVGKTDNKEQNPFSAKGSLDQINDGPLGGKSSTDELPGPLSGRSKTDEINDGPLGGKSSTDELPGPLSGKSSTDELPGPLNGKSKTDEMNGGPLAGKSSTDKLSPPLSGKNKTDKIDDSPLAGRTSTDDLGGPLSNKEGSEEGFFDNTNSSDGFDGFEDPFEEGNEDLVDEEGSDSEESILDDDDFSGAPDGALDHMAALAEHMHDEDFDGTPKQKPRAQKGSFLSSEVHHSSKLELDAAFGEKKKRQEEQDEDANLADAKADDKNSKDSESELDKPISDIKEKKDESLLDKEESMEDALGGDLTEDNGTLKKKAVLEKTDFLDEDKSDDSLHLEGALAEQRETKNSAAGRNFESGEIKVILKQETKTGNVISFICDFEDFYEDELIVRAPKNSLSLDSPVKADVVLHYDGRKIHVNIIGKITNVDQSDDGKDILAISISEIDKKMYDTFITLYQERQSNINYFMDKARGF